MESISVFHMLKIGIGPSSSHTLGPWRAAERFNNQLDRHDLLEITHQIRIILYGSLALTGKGHGTDIALLMGLSGKDPVTVPVKEVSYLPAHIAKQKQLFLDGFHPIHFDPQRDIIFRFSESLPFHANGMTFQAFERSGDLLIERTYYSVGGGFVVEEDESETLDTNGVQLTYPINSGRELLQYCDQLGKCISDVVYQNEKAWNTRRNIRRKLWRIWEVMRESVYNGCHTEGTLPGGLNVKRRASAIHHKLLPERHYETTDEWINQIRQGHFDFSQVIKWIGCFSMAVNEENANFGRIVTAPTNGAAGVIPAVLFYYICFSGHEPSRDDILRFLLVAGEIGSLFKKGSTISAAMGGCQAEIGVSSAMAAAALTERLGGTPAQSLMAAEIAMEHHLGLTCDPVGGLVQVPCIERNSMGAVKAITAAKIALESDPQHAKVSLDDVIKTMWQTALDMNTKYKETSQGGLAANIAISVPEC